MHCVGAAAALLFPMSALLGEENSPWVPVCVGRRFTPLTEERPTSLWDSCPIFLWQKSGFISILFSLPSSLCSRVMLSLQPAACCSHELAFCSGEKLLLKPSPRYVELSSWWRACGSFPGRGCWALKVYERWHCCHRSLLLALISAQGASHISKVL